MVVLSRKSRVDRDTRVTRRDASLHSGRLHRHTRARLVGLEVVIEDAP
jgi:hypothetical protein